jgi:Thioesterase superfamily
MDPKSPFESAALLARWMGIGHANSAGNVHGGTIMKLVDEAAALAAIRHSRKRVVTAAMDRMNFMYPIYLGENGEPSEVPPIIASTPDEQRRQHETSLRRENRLAERAQILAHRERSESGTL